MDNIRFFTGLVFLIAGLLLLVVSFFIWPFIFYAIGLIIFGVLLLLNAGNEEKIEQVKTKKTKSIKKEKN